MGNNEIMLLQFPRTYYFLASLWDKEYKKRQEKEVLRELSEQLYPDHPDVITDSFLALHEKDSENIASTLSRLEKLVHEGSAGRPGAIGRYLFPDRLIVVRNLQAQIEIRLGAPVSNSSFTRQAGRQ